MRFKLDSNQRRLQQNCPQSNVNRLRTDYCLCNLELDPTILIMNFTFQRYTRTPKIYFLGQDIQKLKHYSLTGTQSLQTAGQTDSCDQSTPYHAAFEDDNYTLLFKKPFVVSPAIVIYSHWPTLSRRPTIQCNTVTTMI